MKKFKIEFVHNLHMQGATRSVVYIKARNLHAAEQEARWGEINKYPTRLMSVKVTEVK